MATCGRPDCCRRPAPPLPVAGLLAAFLPPTAGLLTGAGLAAWAGLATAPAALAALAGMALAAVAGARLLRRRHAPGGNLPLSSCEEPR